MFIPKFGEINIYPNILLDNSVFKAETTLIVPPVDEDIIITFLPILEPISIASCKSFIQFSIEQFSIASDVLP